MKYRYIAIDVDGTLLDDQDHFDRQRLNNDINRLRQLGVTLVVASGNSVDALHYLFKDVPVNDYVAENGGRIIVAGRELSGQPHQLATVSALLEYAQHLPAVDLMSASGASRTFIPTRFSTVPVPYYPHHTYFTDVADIDEPIYNVNFSWARQRLSRTRLDHITQQINQDFPSVNATYSGTYGIDILPYGVNKAAGMEEYVTRTGGSINQVIAIGDTANDIEMVRAAGLGIAMQNATSDLKAVADRITAADNNHDGLLREIETLFNLK